MKTRIYTLGIILGLLLLTLPRVVRADDIVSLTLSNVTFTGSSVCGPVCTETFSGSFLWDNTTGALVLGSGQVSSAGALLGPPFAFAGAGLAKDFLGLPFLEALWTSPDEIAAIVNGVPTLVSTNTTDEIVLNIFFGLNPPILPNATCDISDSFCQSASLEMSCLPGSGCSSDFPNSEPGSFFLETPTTGTLSIATVPEPNSLVLLGTGLLGVMALTWRKETVRLARRRHPAP